MEPIKIDVLPDGRVKRRDAARFLGVSPKTMAEWQSHGKGPQSRLVGGRRFYQLTDLQSFVGGASV